VRFICISGRAPARPHIELNEAPCINRGPQLPNSVAGVGYHCAQHLCDTRREGAIARFQMLTTPNATQQRAVQLLQQITA